MLTCSKELKKKSSCALTQGSILFSELSDQKLLFYGKRNIVLTRTKTPQLYINIIILMETFLKELNTTPRPQIYVMVTSHLVRNLAEGDWSLLPQGIGTHCSLYLEHSSHYLSMDLGLVCKSLLKCQLSEGSSLRTI